MWKNLSLQMRLLLPLCALFLVAIVFSVIVVQFFSPTQVREENEPALRSAKVVAEALNGALKIAENPQQTLDGFVQGLGNSESIQFRRIGSNPKSTRNEAGTPLRVPSWFIEMLELPAIDASYPVFIGDQSAGSIVFAPDVSADIFEKWVGFLALLASGGMLILMTGTLSCLTARSVAGALQDLGDGLTRLRMGDYRQMIATSGPPEMRKSAEEANELARTLDRLSHDNALLLRKVVSLQDDERREIARELHDELGPILFGIRANAVALQETYTKPNALSESLEAVVHNVEALQQTNRRILDRLRPLYILELGLVNSIQTLFQNARSQAPVLRMTSDIDPGLNGVVDGLVSQTVYRVIQESVTNALRHSRAKSLHARATMSGQNVFLEISDDGVGFSPDQAFGRGLTGMSERVRALSGTFEFIREAGRTCIRCRLPIQT